MQQVFGNIGNIGSLDSGSVSLPSSISAPSLLGGQSPQHVRSFSSTLADSLNKVNETIGESIKTTNGLLSGNMKDLSEVTVAGAKAGVAMKLTTTIVSKLAQATTQLFQMQI